MLRLFIVLLTVGEVITIVASVKLLGLFTTLLLAALAFIIGLSLLRREGLATLERFTTRLQLGEPPMAEAWEGMCLVLAALLLMLPGLLSDVIALALLIPFIRRSLWRVASESKRAENSYLFKKAPSKPPRNDNNQRPVIDAEWRELP
jgi:UPF0716 protein FxsA